MKEFNSQPEAFFANQPVANDSMLASEVQGRGLAKAGFKIATVITLIGCTSDSGGLTSVAVKEDTSTKTIIPSSTPLSPAITPMVESTPEPTLEIELTHTMEPVNMTRADWENLFSTVTYHGDNFKEYSGNTIFETSKILTTQEEILEFDSGRQMAILNTNGLVEIFAEPDYAAEKLSSGAVVLASIDSATSGSIAKYALLVAAEQNKLGNDDIKVTFNDLNGADEVYVTLSISDLITPKGVIPSRIATDQSGAYFPVLVMPETKNIVVSTFDGSSITLEEAGILEEINQNQNDWIDIIAGAGFDQISVKP